MSCCSPGSAPPAGLTWLGRSRTPPTCARSKGAHNRTKPSRPRPRRLQAPRPDRRDRHPTGRHRDWQPPQRRHPAHSLAGYGPTHPRPRRSAAAQAQDAGRRPWLRPRKYRRLLRARGIRPAIARRGVPYGPELGRWRVERTIAWLHQYRRLRIRWERRTDIHQAFLKLACCLICWRCLQRSFS
jgi:hypothetical protein